MFDFMSSNTQTQCPQKMGSLHIQAPETCS